MSNDTRIAVDVAKAVFEIAISDRAGHIARRVRLPRAQFLPFMAQQPVATVVMEACGSAHYWAREIQKLGHCVVLLTTSAPTSDATRPIAPTPRASCAHRSAFTARPSQRGLIPSKGRRTPRSAARAAIGVAGPRQLHLVVLRLLVDPFTGIPSVGFKRSRCCHRAADCSLYKHATAALHARSAMLLP
jgi:hypothetical protein